MKKNNIIQKWPKTEKINKKLSKDKIRKKIDDLNKQYFNGKLNFRIYHQLLAEYLPQLHKILRDESQFKKDLENAHHKVLTSICMYDRMYETLDSKECDNYFKLLKLERKLSKQIFDLSGQLGLKINE